MIVPFERLNDGAYVVLNTAYSIRSVAYDPRVARQSVCFDWPLEADEDLGGESAAAEDEEGNT